MYSLHICADGYVLKTLPVLHVPKRLFDERLMLFSSHALLPLEIELHSGDSDNSLKVFSF